MEEVLTQQQIDTRDAATVPLSRKASAVVAISDADESPEQAVLSIIENHDASLAIRRMLSSTMVGSTI